MPFRESISPWPSGRPHPSAPAVAILCSLMEFLNLPINILKGEVFLIAPFSASCRINKSLCNQSSSRVTAQFSKRGAILLPLSYGGRRHYFTTAVNQSIGAQFYERGEILLPLDPPVEDRAGSDKENSESLKQNT